MYPILAEIGRFKLYTYGVFVALGFVIASEFAAREARRVGESPARILDIAFWFVIAGIIGARILFIFMNIDEYVEEPIKILKVWEGGLAWYGGIVGALLSAYIYTRRHKMSFAKTLDIIAPAAALGLAIGRWGCFSAGCCYGKHTELPWAVTFTDPRSLAITGVPIHPTQVYESLGAFFMFVILRGLKKKRLFDPKEDIWLLVFWSLVRFYMLWKGAGLPLISLWDIPGIIVTVGFFYGVKFLAVKARMKFDGMIVILWFLLYSVLRFCLEYLRGVEGVTGWWVKGYLSTTHVLTALAFVICVFLLTRKWSTA